MPEPFNRAREYERIRRGLRRMVAKLEQACRVVNHWNGLSQADRPLDFEPDRIALHHAREALRLWEAGDTVAAGEPLKLIEKALAEALDDA